MFTATSHAHIASLTIAHYVALLRLKQWTKNLVCFLPLFCSGQFGLAGEIMRVTITATAFCFAASFVYILNDIMDQNEDRSHPSKRYRPIAAGDISSQKAIATGIFLLAACLILSLCNSLAVFYIIVFYLLVNIGYSLHLKRVPVLDVMLISAGFILRLVAGGQSAHVPISAWLVLCAFFLSLFLAFGKRRAELNHPNPHVNRAVLSDYTCLLLDRFSNIAATLAIASYSVFTVLSRPDHALLITCPPVVFGMFRYLFLLESQHEGEAPDVILLRDRPIQITIMVWLLSYTAVLYFHFRLAII